MAILPETIHIVGAGLAGSECAYQLAKRGHKVVLYEMRQKKMTPAHKTQNFAELVCSNSFGSDTEYSAPGQLKWEAGQLDSLILSCAQSARVPAGMALAVDREIFAQKITETLKSHPNVEIKNEVIESLDELPRPAVIATGPLTDSSLASDLQKHFGNDFLYFFDAIAPIIDADSINMDIAWFADRYGKGTNDYLNLPLNKQQYDQLMQDIALARKIEPKDFEQGFENTPYFEGCMPIEVMVERGPETARHGPLSAKGLRLSGPEDLYAVVQLRKENNEATAYNMVGFQTKMAYGEQSRIFKTIPGLEEAEFLKLGSIHRNLYIHSPKMLNSDLSSKNDPNLHFAGQISGVEGYFESTCMGLIVALLLHQKLTDQPKNPPPRDTALGSLLSALTEPRDHFQPTNINFSLFPNLTLRGLKGRKNRGKKREMMLERAKSSLNSWLCKLNENEFQ